jgi:hypothetical protein
VLFEQYGLREIWEEAYGEVENVTWLSAGAWDPCHGGDVPLDVVEVGVALVEPLGSG